MKIFCSTGNTDKVVNNLRGRQRDPPPKVKPPIGIEYATQIAEIMTSLPLIAELRPGFVFIVFLRRLMQIFQ